MAVVCALLLWLLFAPAVDVLEEGRKALAGNQPGVAEPLLRKGVEADPSDYTAHFDLALSLSLQHKDSEAIAELRHTLELKPGLYEANLNLGILLLRNSQAGDALAVLQAAVAAKPKEARAHLYLAQAFLNTGDAAQAEQNYVFALEADPNSKPAHLGLAQALLKQSRLPEAAGHFRTAGYKEGLLEVANAYEGGGRMEEAIALYREFPDNSEVRAHLGRMLSDSGNARAAIPDLEDAVRKAPTVSNRLTLADAYKIVGRNAEMMEQLQLAAASAPQDFDLRMAYGRALRDRRELTAASGQFSAAAAIQPNSTEAWNELASALIVNQNYAEGLAALDRVHALGREIPGDFFLRAITLDKLKQKPQALAAYRQFLDADKGAHPDQDFQARQRTRIIESELSKK